MIPIAGGRIEIEVAPDLRQFPTKLKSGLSGVGGIASALGKGLGLAVAAGTGIAAVGLKNVIQLGNDYTANLNEMQAVSGSTAAEMSKVGSVAKALGADMTLPATSAADAAAAMVELTKGGLSVAESMEAAKGTLQLAAAASIDGATAAEIQSSALNAFGLSADNAGRVADVLANTANAAAGSITDIGNSMKYVAPVSAALGVSIEDTAAAIGLLANQGVKGEQAGTSLRGILASLASPSAAAAEALGVLGVKAFDTQGKFVGLRSFTDQLAQAKGRLTDAEFAAAASTAFGNEGFTAANALAAEGAISFDEMAASVGRAGGAADVAAAKTKGLGGAWEGFKSQLETAGIEVYEVIAPPLERLTRSAADFVSNFTPKIVSGIQTAVAAGEIFGPGLADAIRSKAGDLAGVAGDILEPLADGIKDSLNSAINLGIRVFGGFADVVREGADAVIPLAEGIGDVVESVNRADGPVGALGAGLGLIYDAASGLISILSPVISLVGGLVSGFAGLPGPIQTAAVAILALKVGPSILSGLKSAFSGAKTEADGAAKQTGVFGRAMGAVLAPVRIAAAGITSTVGVVRQFNDEARVQQSVAAGAGVQIGRMGAAAAAFNTSTIPAVATARGFAEQTAAIRAGAAAAGQPISAMGAAIGTLVERSSTLSAMRASFDTASAGATRFGAAAGTAAAAGTGLRLAAGGLVGALGGPFGIAIAGAGILLSVLASNEAEAAKSAAEHKNRVRELADTLDQSTGAITSETRALITKQLAEKDLINSGRALGINADTLVSASLGQADALKIVREQLIGAARDSFTNGEAFDEARSKLEGYGITAEDIVGAVTGNADAMVRVSAAAAAAGINLDELGLKENNNLSDTLSLGVAMGVLGGNVDEAQAIIDQTSAAMTPASIATQGFKDTVAVLGDATADADTKARALKDALDALSGGKLNLERATAQLNERLAGLGELFGENLDKTKGWGAELLNADGSINTVTENGRRLFDSMEGISESMAGVAQATFDAATAQGDSLPVAMEKAKAAAQTTRDAFIAQHEQMGLTATQATALADKYGLIPADIATLITSPGMDDTQIELLLLKNAVDAVPPNKAIRVESLSDAARQKLIELGFTVRDLPDGSVEVIANDQAAKNKLNQFTADYDHRVFDWSVRLTIPNVRGPRGLSGDGGYNEFGNIVTAAYAKGGVHQKLTPMKAGLAAVVPPNTWRVVGDRLRDDEFYIPDNEDARSMAIGREWARRRGLVLARRFAEGGVASTSSRTLPQQVDVRAPVNINMPVQVQDNRSATEFARVASAAIAWEQRFTG